MVDKKTNSKKDAVKASGKNPASAKKPVNASADPAAAGSVHCVDREYILPDISIDTEVYKRVLSCDDMHKFRGMNAKCAGLALPSVDDLDYGTDCDDLIKAGVFASIVSSGDGVENKADCYISALQAYNHLARAARVLDGLIDPSGEGLHYKICDPLIAFLSNKDIAAINSIVASLFNDVSKGLDCLENIALNSTYNGDGGRFGGRLAGVEY